MHSRGSGDEEMVQEGAVENQRSCFYAFWRLVAFSEFWFSLVLGRGFMLMFLTELAISKYSEVI